MVFSPSLKQKLKCLPEVKFFTLTTKGSEALVQAAPGARGAPSLGVPKARLDGAGGSLGWWEVSLPWQGLELDDL